MYLQITTKCNMTCEHCCFSCNSKGDNMTFETFEKMVEVAENYGMYITIGGGEPTVHPEFYDFVNHAVDCLYDDKRVMVITNGKIKERALWLLDMDVDEEKLDTCLSLDSFHDSIDEEVERTFRNYNRVRTVDPYHVRKHGRAKDWARVDECVCPSLFIAPNGDVKACGCEDSPIYFNVVDLTTEEIEEKLDQLHAKYSNEDWNDGFGYSCHKDLVLRKEVA